MLTSTPASWSVRGATFALWLLAAGSAVFWGLKLGSGPATVAPAASGARSVAAVDPQAIARLLGGVPQASTASLPAAPALASRFALVGVVARANSGGGAAVISVDGKPARPYRVGSAIDEGLVLQSVQGRRAVIGTQADGQPVLTLELPAIQQKK
jgi:general secretion pathway protein C